MSVIKIISEEEWKEQMEAAGDKPVMVDFFATWCPPCVKATPIFEEFAKEYEGRVVILKVDVDECEEISKEHGITSMPTFVLFKNGKEEKRLSGFSEGLPHVKEAIDAILA